MNLVGIKPTFSKIFLREWHPYFWIILVVSLVYFKTLAFQYTYMDDDSLILNNQNFIHHPEHVIHSFFRTVHYQSIFYRPVLIISLIADACPGGASLLSYHLTNGIIHLIACSLLFTLLMKSGYHRGYAWWCALFFGVHPLLVPAVAWIPGRNDSLLGVAVLASFIFLIDYGEQHRLRDYLLHLFFFTMALFTKETAVVAVVVFGSYIILLAKEKFSSPQLRLLAAGWAIAGVMWFALRLLAVSSSLSTATNAWTDALLAMTQYAGKMIFPFNLSVMPTIKNTGLGWGIAAIFLILAVLWLGKDRRRGYLYFGGLWIVLFLLPPMLFGYNGIYYEHRCYVPLIGLFFIFPEAQYVIQGRPALKKIVMAGGLLVLAIFAAISFRQCDYFSGRMAFWKNAVKTSPNFFFSHVGLAHAYIDARNYDYAHDHILQAYVIAHGIPMVHGIYGVLFQERQEWAKAREAFGTAVKLDPHNDEAWKDLGAIHIEMKNYREAITCLCKALAINPEDADTYRNLGLLYSKTGEHEKALSAYRKAVEISTGKYPLRLPVFKSI